LERLQAELESARADEQAVKEEQEAKKAEQQAKVAEAEKVLEELNQNVEEVNRQLEAEDEAAAAIQADIVRKQAELEAQRQQQNVTLPVSSTGFQWPLPASNLKLTSAFGYRIHPVTHVPHSHTGIDVSATTGTPITAAKSGQVIISEKGTGSTWSYGEYVVIDHGDGTTTLYAHMSYRAVSEGQIVTQGQYIGDVGATGNVTGPHLHFEVRKNGQRVDPEECFPDLYNSFIRAYNW
ncbi:M23 family metallopeptidase, partial [Pseudoflavonifractor phocaeensis]|uniref:M23 family metallopeptidase n=1 Tax=Pseudoflavonifractor phocaeensis TaxID=1870988 RepID=UPI00195F0F1D